MEGMSMIMVFGRVKREKRLMDDELPEGIDDEDNELMEGVNGENDELVKEIDDEDNELPKGVDR